MSSDRDLRTYRRADCAVFRKTAEEYGGLSNMAPGFPVRINGVRILTVEALYQACRFPHLPEVQRKIIEQTSPMTAKMVGKPYRADSRPDWDRVRVKIMRWVLRLKLAMHWTQFSALLLSTGERPIVEDSRKDDFWGAMPSGPDTLVGMNVLGRLLMELREEIKQGVELRQVAPAAISDLLLYGKAIGAIDFRADESQSYPVRVSNSQTLVSVYSSSLFGDEMAVSQGHLPIADTHLPTIEAHAALLDGLIAYPENKESGQKWLGAIPSHWDLILGHAAFTKRKVLNDGLKENTVLSLSYGRIKVKPTDKQHGLVPDSYETYQIVKTGNVIVRGTDLQNDKTSLRVGLAQNDGIISSAYLCLQTNPSVLPEYGYQILNVFDLTKAIYRYGSGLRQNLDHGEIKRLPIFLPPVGEQVAIVRFLEHANRKINGFILAKRKLVALLNEQKQAIVHRAVTRGLDANAPLKPSGIPSLGEIPAHWNVLRTRFLFRAVTRRDVRKDDPKLSVTQRHGLIRTDEMLENSTQARNFDRFQVCHPNDLVLNKYKAHLGVFCCAFQRGLITPNYTVFRPTCHLYTHYFDLLFHTTTYKNAFRMLVYGVTEGMSPLYTQDFYRVPALFPPIEEQKAIVERLVELTRTQDEAITRIEREIALMQEYRTRLTAEIVTGKLDVREAAARLPDLIDEETSEVVAEDLLDETETEES
jgi:type I restriction enzyme S subunit